jgi:hypothetical protein
MHPDTRAVQIGVVATILVHVALLSLAPKIESWISPAESATPSEDWASKEFQIELSPVDVTAPVDPPRVQLPQFVEANPNAPDNAPDKTDFVAAQNQQVAQPTPTPENKSDAPASKGERNSDSTAVVSGQSAESRPVVLQSTIPSTAESRAAAQTEEAPATPEQEAARRAQTPLPGYEAFSGDNPTGYGTTVAPAAPGASAVPERVEGLADAKNDTGSRSGLYYKVDAKRPQARAKLPTALARARSSPLVERALGTDNIGAVAYNAKWSSYGEYLQKLIETVDVQWQRILNQSDVYPPAGTKVTVVFRLDSKGEIAEILNVTGGGGRSAQDACVSAIVARAPYGNWSADMIGVLGESQEITFSFFYN